MPSLKRWNATLGAWEYVLGGDGGGSSAPADLYSVSLGTPYQGADHTLGKMMGGVFVPKASTVDVEVNWAGKVIGVGHMSSFFAWNSTVAAGTDLMTGVGFGGGAYVSGTSWKTLGAASGDAVGSVSRRFRITGLTPDTPVTWELTTGATGYYEAFQLGAGTLPTDVALSQDGQSVFVTEFFGNRVVALYPGSRWENLGLVKEIGRLDNHPGAYGVCAHPTDPNRIYISRFSANEVVEVDPRTNQVLRTWAVTGPYWVITDGTTLFVVRSDANAVVPIDITSGTIETQVTVGGYPMKPIISGTYLYVACPSDHTVSRIHTGTNAHTSLAMGGATKPVSVAANPDGSRVWVLERDGGFVGGNRVRAIDTATFAFAADTPVTGITEGSSGSTVLLSPTGKSLYVLSTGGTPGNDLHTFQLPSKSVRFETADVTTTGGLWTGAITAEGDIVAVEQVDAGVVHHWHAGMMEIDESNSFWGGFADVLVTPAVTQ